MESLHKRLGINVDLVDLETTIVARLNSIKHSVSKVPCNIVVVLGGGEALEVAEIVGFEVEDSVVIRGTPSLMLNQNNLWDCRLLKLHYTIGKDTLAGDSV